MPLLHRYAAAGHTRRQFPSRPHPTLACGCRVMSDSTMHSTSERVIREMLREQSAPPGANQWYSRPAMVMQPAGQHERAGSGNNNAAPQRNRGKQRSLSSAALGSAPARQRQRSSTNGGSDASVCMCPAQRPAAGGQHAQQRMQLGLTRICAQRDPQQRVEVAPILLPSLHPRVVPVLGHVLRGSTVKGPAE